MDNDNEIIIENIDEIIPSDNSDFHVQQEPIKCKSLIELNKRSGPNAISAVKNYGLYTVYPTPIYPTPPLYILPDGHHFELLNSSDDGYTYKYVQNNSSCFNKNSGIIYDSEQIFWSKTPVEQYNELIIPISDEIEKAEISSSNFHYHYMQPTGSMKHLSSLASMIDFNLATAPINRMKLAAEKILQIDSGSISDNDSDTDTDNDNDSDSDSYDFGQDSPFKHDSDSDSYESSLEHDSDYDS